VDAVACVAETVVRTNAERAKMMANIESTGKKNERRCMRVLKLKDSWRL